MSSPTRQQIREYARVADQVVADSRNERTIAVQNGKGSAESPTVRTLHGPPEIWELVHPAPPQRFSPGSAFVARITASKTNFILLSLSVILISGICTFGILRLLNVQKLSGIATQIEESRSTNQVEPSTPTATSSANGAHDAGGGSPVQTNPTPDNPATASESLTVRSTETSANDDSTIRDSLMRQTAVRSRRKPGRVVSGQQSLENQSRSAVVETTSKAGTQSQTQPIASPSESDKKTVAQPAPVSPKSGTTLSPKLIAPSATSPGPKAKVIQWP